MAERRSQRGLLDPESEVIAEAYAALPAVRRQTRGLLSLEPQKDQSMAQTALEAVLGFIPGVGQALAARDIERARRDRDPTAAALAATEFVPFGRLAGMMRRPGPIMSELDVYHGTPHRFPATEANPLGEFDASKIGTGEGAQAFGHGIYLAEKPTVAQDYQFMLSKIDPETVTYQGKPVQHWYDMAQAEQDRAHRLRDQKAIDRANAKLAFWENVMTRRHPEDAKRVANDPDDGWPTLANYANSLDMSKFGGIGEAGSLYKADLPDEMIDRMLDWDKPLSEQPAAIQEIARKIGIGKAVGRTKAKLQAFIEGTETPETDRVAKGEDLYRALSDYGNESVAGTRALQEAGIPGIKYLDAGSRGQGGSGTRNFVVFPGEEKKVKILERK
jgi:hypothetical protein